MKKKKYQIITLDVPWEYEDKALAGNRGAGCKYDVMSDEEIKNLPIQKLTQDTCTLFMWVTLPKLNVCFDIIEHWGFKYKTVAFVWVKTTKNNKLHWGMGSWTRSNTELCLLAIKGKPKRINADVHQVILAPRKEHSAKPPIVLDKIVELMGDLPRVELFSRTVVEGWDRWGNETISNVDFI